MKPPIIRLAPFGIADTACSRDTVRMVARSVGVGAFRKHAAGFLGPDAAQQCLHAPSLVVHADPAQLADELHQLIGALSPLDARLYRKRHVRLHGHSPGALAQSTM